MPTMFDQQDQQMNWKATFLVIIGVLFVCVIVFGILSYKNILDRNALETDAQVTKEVLGRTIEEVTTASQFIANHPLIQQWELNPKIIDDDDILIVLNTIKYMLGATIVYIMDTNGMVLVCTPYDDNKTLTGNNYKFRPYFLKAMDGNDYVYPALGVTTHERGIYFSSPIYLQNNLKPVGVAVIKLHLGRFDKILKNTTNQYIAGLISPSGIIFSSTEESWLFKSSLKLTTAEREKIMETRQFGDETLEPLGVNLSTPRVKYNNNTYFMTKENIAVPNWKIFLMSQTNELNPLPPLLMSVILFFIFGISYIILAVVYGKEKRKARKEKRK